MQRTTSVSPSRDGVEDARAPLFTAVSSENDATVNLYFDGHAVSARPGDTVAAALLRAGVPAFRRTPESGAPRLPFCMIGHCFECLVEIDGAPYRQACLTLVSEGMQIRLQDGEGRIGL